jgi:hypothetical protein
MRLRTLLLAMAAAVSMVPASAQWLNYPEKGTPVTPDGKPNLSARAPRALDGKPDLSGVWQIEPPPPGEIERIYGAPGVQLVAGDDPANYSKYIFNLFVDFKPEESPLRPEAIAAARNKRSTDQPTAHCLPLGLPARELIAFPFKVFQSPDALGIFYEADGAFRQIHIDGRKLPADPQPTWLGYSTARWEDDTLVVETAGFNDRNWIDFFGHPQSEELRVEERFHRRDFGHLDVQATIQDPKTLTRPVTIRFTERLIPNSDVMENFCVEGERDLAHMSASTQ